MRINPTTYRLYTLIAAPKIHADLLWDLFLLFSALCVLYLGTTFFFKRKFSVGLKTIGNRKKELSPMISEFLFYDENGPKEEKTNYVNLKIEIRELLNDDLNRKVLIDILMDLRKDLSGVTLYKLFDLYQSLGLHHDSYKRLDHWRWPSVSKGIVELTQMNVTDSYGFLKKFINSKRPTIRKQAEIAIVSLKNEGINYFLDSTTHKISEWQQLKILEVLSNKIDFQPPSFKHWLISKNKDVVLFSLRLLKHYGQGDGNQALIELLKHKNNEIKAAAVTCTKEFHVVEAIETLKLVFWNGTVDIKLNILHAIASLGSVNDIGFLESIGSKEANFNVRSKALATINSIAPHTVLPTKDIHEVQKFKIPDDLSEKVLNESDSEQSVGLLVELEPFETTEIDSVAPPKKVVKEKYLQKAESEPKKKDLEPEPEKNDIESSFELDFLPVVIEKSIEGATNRYRPKPEIVEGDHDVLGCQVVFETVECTSKAESDAEAITASRKLDDSSDATRVIPLLDFLPIVVAPEKPIDRYEPTEAKGPIDISAIPVTYTEIKTENLETETNDIVSEPDKPVPLPKAPKNKKNIGRKKKLLPNSEQPTSLSDIDMGKAREIECTGDEIKIELQSEAQEAKAGAIKKDAKNTLDWIMAENEAEGQQKLKIKKRETEEEILALNIPKPIFYSEREANVVALLDDIEELGDEREIPLLNDLLYEETNQQLRLRIQRLIKKFCDCSTLSKDPHNLYGNHELRSIFEDYFKRLDSESQLILLDEIVAVGDEKELAFLKRLSTSASSVVEKKAQVCLIKLNDKLELEKDLKPSDLLQTEEGASEKIATTLINGSDSFAESNELELDNGSGVFDIDFELDMNDCEAFEQRPE
jgi:hypothetical protein